MSSLTIEQLQTQVIFLQVVNRLPTDTELSNYSAQLSAATLTETDLISYLKTTTEYLKIIGQHSGDTTFSSWSLYCSNISEVNYNPLTIANGKLALITAGNKDSISKSLISTNFDFNDIGSYTNNVTETFDYTTFNLYDRDETKVSISNLKQSLNTLTANFTTTYTVYNSNSMVDVTSDLRALQQYPYCTLQTITLRANSNMNLDVYHNINTPLEEIHDVRYNNNIINTTLNDTNSSLYFFQANGLIKNIEKNISTCCGYVFDSNNVSYKGYNISQNDTNNAFTKFTLAVQSNIDTKFHIISSTMTQLDFLKPDIETQRILINVLTHTPDEIISDHVSEWSKLWGSVITIAPKDGITTAESDEINLFNQYIKLSLYNIYSSVRNDFNVDINPLNISSIDISGHIMFLGELWLIPVLTLLMPKAARSLLDYRYHQLENSIKLAAAHGYKGSKYAYQNDIIGYNNVYWNTVAPLQIFNTGLISVAVWNYYRVTRDLDWLQKKGFEILKNNADFFISKLETIYTKDGDGNNTITVDYYNINSVYGIDGTSGDNNSITNYLAKLAIQYALQAKYELNYGYNVDWDIYIDKIKLEIIQSPSPEITATIPDIATSNTRSLYNILSTNKINTPTIAEIMEPLLILHPYYSKYFFNIRNNTDTGYEYDVSTIKDNLDAYSQRLSSTTENNSFNKLMLATLYGRIAQLENVINSVDYRANAIDLFRTEMLSFFDNSTLNPWKTFYNSQYTKIYNDIGVSSMFILSLLTTIIGLKITGSIDDAKNYLEDLGITSTTANIMPRTWKSIEVYGVGLAPDNTLHYCVLNQLLYTI
jgi:trehalose/maltose hydrolase-like predicted phosphorylase